MSTGGPLGGGGSEGIPPQEPAGLAGPTTAERLIEAAGEGFTEQGYDRVRVQDIARRAGLTTGAIYANFRNKAGLLLQTINALTTTHFDGGDRGGEASAGSADDLGETVRTAVSKSNARA